MSLCYLSKTLYLKVLSAKNLILEDIFNDDLHTCQNIFAENDFQFSSMKLFIIILVIKINGLFAKILEIMESKKTVIFFDSLNTKMFSA